MMQSKIIKPGCPRNSLNAITDAHFFLSEDCGTLYEKKLEPVFFNTTFAMSTRFCVLLGQYSYTRPDSTRHHEEKKGAKHPVQI